MGVETMNVPEEHLVSVIKVIRNGISATPILNMDVRNALLEWCNGEEDYLLKLADDDPEPGDGV